MLLCFSSAEMLGFHEEDHGACNPPASAVRSQSVELTAHRSDHNLRQERQYQCGSRRLREPVFDQCWVIRIGLLLA